MERVYLDYAASAPLAPEAKEVINHFTQTFKVGNPSSMHKEGRQAQALLDKAHTTIGAVFGVSPTEVVLTSGATESNNVAIQGVLRAWRKEKGTKPHVVMSALEHSSWREVALAEDAEVTIVPANPSGFVSAEAMIKAITPDTALVGCMYVQNEIGTIQPVAEIGKTIQEQRGTSRWPVFHVDAVQAFPYLNTHIGHIKADTVTFSGHKYGALGGIGILLVKSGTPLDKVIRGGGQEWGQRAGTENILGALTLARMIEYGDAERENLKSHVQKLQTYLEKKLMTNLPDVAILGAKGERVPHITYVWLPGVTDEHIVHKLDLAGIAVSSGSACSSGAQLPSSTLLALGYSAKEAYGGIRVSIGRATTQEDLDAFVVALEACIV